MFNILILCLPFRWIVDMEGATGTLYEGEKFQLLFKFSSRYPFDSPQVSRSCFATICVCMCLKVRHWDGFVLFLCWKTHCKCCSFTVLSWGTYKVLSVSTLTHKLLYWVWTPMNKQTCSMIRFWLQCWLSILKMRLCNVCWAEPAAATNHNCGTVPNCYTTF